MTDTDDGEGPEYDVDFRENPEEYEIGRGEEGVFEVQPYKDELLPPWTIKTFEGAEESAEAILERYEEYREADDFPGMDMAREYLQMGYTRSMRYAKYPGGRKYVHSEAQRASDANTAELRSADRSSEQSSREDGETVSEGEEREPEEWADPEKREIALRRGTVRAGARGRDVPTGEKVPPRSPKEPIGALAGRDLPGSLVGLAFDGDLADADAAPERTTSPVAVRSPVARSR
ncbi:DUF4385 family protein [Halalkalicoccus salilacus]|uniref:DUF4385 family protein n=1 Tax=Halalkalicoccus sp. GCM10025704 TaxID=3252662 RepID=UPI0036232BFC